MTKLLLILALLLLPTLAPAQITADPEPGVPDITIDGAENLFQQVQGSMDALVVRDDLAELGAIEFALFLFLRLYGVVRLQQDSEGMLEELSDVLVTGITTGLIMGYYSSPLPGMVISLHQVPSFIAKLISGVFDLAVVTDMFARFGDVTTLLEHPAWYDVSGLVVYFVVEVLMLAMDAVLFVITIWGFIGHGFCEVLGRLFVPFFMTKRNKGRFWNWLDWLISFAMYRAVASMMTSLWAGVVIRFFNNSVNGNYSLTHWTVLAAALVVLSGGFIFCMVKVPSITERFFNGLGHSMEGFGMGLIAAASKKLAAFA